MNLRGRFLQYLEQNQFFKTGETAFVACSGGPDSVALFFLLKNLSAHFKIKLGLIHFNHGLRGKASDADADFVKKLARKNKVFFAGGRAGEKYNPRLKQSLEEWARFERYTFFSSAAKKGNFKKILTAHTLNDQAETVLMRIIQGTGPQGLLGIRKKMIMKSFTLARPLLEFSKKELLEFLRENNIPFRKDASNDSPRFLRNRIRRGLLPLIEKEYNPRIYETLARIPQILEEETSLLEDLNKKAWEQCFLGKTAGKIRLRKNVFLKLSGYLKFWILDRALKMLNSRSGMSFDAWQRLKSGLMKTVYRQSLPKELDFELTPSHILIYRKTRVS